MCLKICLHSVESAAETQDQIPNLKSLPDSTTVLQKSIDDRDGNLLLGKDEVIRITRPLVFDLAKHKAVAVKAATGTPSCERNSPKRR